jgi:DNA polymerase
LFSQKSPGLDGFLTTKRPKKRQGPIEQELETSFQLIAMTAADLARMAFQHAQSLQAAGIDWIPAAVERASGCEEGGEKESRRERKVESEERRSESPPAVASSGSDLVTPNVPKLSTGEKRLQLQMMYDREVKDCPKCIQLVRSRTQTVFGVGNIDAELVFVGEAPGADEDKQGEPFVGAAGQLLNKIITACNMKREEIYIANVLKCRPPGNRTPQADEVAHCRGYLDRQLAIIRPRFICCLGSVAAQTLLNTTNSIGRLRKMIHDYQGMKLVATYHPAYLLRNPAAKKDVWEDMKMLMKAMGRAI